MCIRDRIVRKTNIPNSLVIDFYEQASSVSDAAELKMLFLSIFDEDKINKHSLLNMSSEEKVSMIKEYIQKNNYIYVHDILMRNLKELKFEIDSFSEPKVINFDSIKETVSFMRKKPTDFSRLLCIYVYWGQDDFQMQKTINKVFSYLIIEIQERALDKKWIALYPIVIIFYCFGVVCIELERYDLLSNLFYTEISNLITDEIKYFIECFGEVIIEIQAIIARIQDPRSTKINTAYVSDHMYESADFILSRDLFFEGIFKSRFNDFEILMAMCIAENADESKFWFPLGRFSKKVMFSAATELDHYIKQNKHLKLAESFFPRKNKDPKELEDLITKIKSTAIRTQWER